MSSPAKSDMHVGFGCRALRALDIGHFIDVSQTAREEGIHYPVAVSEDVWKHLVLDPTSGEGQGATCRLRNVLYMMRLWMQRATEQQRLIRFPVIIQDGGEPWHVNLVAQVDRDEDGRPAVLVMLPGMPAGEMYS